MCFLAWQIFGDVLVPGGLICTKSRATLFYRSITLTYLKNWQKTMFRISYGKNMIFMFRLAKKESTETHSLSHTQTNTCRDKHIQRPTNIGSIHYSIFVNISEYDPQAIFSRFSIHYPILFMISIHDKICVIFSIHDPSTLSSDQWSSSGGHTAQTDTKRPLACLSGVCWVSIGFLLGAC